MVAEPREVDEVSSVAASEVKNAADTAAMEDVVERFAVFMMVVCHVICTGARSVSGFPPCRPASFPHT